MIEAVLPLQVPAAQLDSSNLVQQPDRLPQDTPWQGCSGLEGLFISAY